MDIVAPGNISKFLLGGFKRGELEMFYAAETPKVKPSLWTRSVTTETAKVVLEDQCEVGHGQG